MKMLLIFLNLTLIDVVGPFTLEKCQAEKVEFEKMVAQTRYPFVISSDKFAAECVDVGG